MPNSRGSQAPSFHAECRCLVPFQPGPLRPQKFSPAEAGKACREDSAQSDSGKLKPGSQSYTRHSSILITLPLRGNVGYQQGHLWNGPVLVSRICPDSEELEQIPWWLAEGRGREDWQQRFSKAGTSTAELPTPWSSNHSVKLLGISNCNSKTKITITIQTPKSYQSIETTVASYRIPWSQSLMEPGNSPKHLLTVSMKFFQLIFNQGGIQRLALLNQMLPKND